MIIKKFSQFTGCTEDNFPSFSNLYILGTYKGSPRKILFNNFKSSAFRAYNSRISTVNNQISSVVWNEENKELAEQNKAGVSSSAIWVIDEAEHLSKNNIFYEDIIILNRPLSVNDRKNVGNNIKLAVNFELSEPINLGIETIKDLHTTNNTLKYIFSNDDTLKTISLSEKAMKNVASIDESFINCINLISLDGDYTFSNIVSGVCAFKNCSNLKIFDKDLSSLKNGEQMFSNCLLLETFSASLDELTEATEMFNGCKLDLQSLEYIATTINDLTAQDITKPITLGVNDIYNENENVQTFIDAMTAKGWVVTVQYNV